MGRRRKLERACTGCCAAQDDQALRRRESCMQSSDLTNGSVPVSSVPLLDIGRQNAPLREEIRAAIDRVCDSGKFILGPEVEDLERNVANYTGAKHAIGCASGSDALLLALMALGIGPGDEVILPSFTFFATASAVWRLGRDAGVRRHRSGDVQSSPEPTICARSRRATKAIIPVHLFGQCADMDAHRIRSPQQRGLPIIEDACQAIGAEVRRPASGHARRHRLLQLLSDQKPGRLRRRRHADDQPRRAGRAAAPAAGPRHGAAVLPSRWWASTAGSILFRPRC